MLDIPELHNKKEICLLCKLESCHPLYTLHFINSQVSRVKKHNEFKNKRGNLAQKGLEVCDHRVLLPLLLNGYYCLLILDPLTLISLLENPLVAPTPLRVSI